MNFPYLCTLLIYFLLLAALASKTLLEQLQNNFNVTAPASLEFEIYEDPVALARQLYLHYIGSTYVDETQAEGLKNVSCNDRHIT